jgi:hypothetical protein
MNKKQWKRKYYYLCDKATKLFDKYNPCDFNKHGRCIHCRELYQKSCCGDCQHLGKNGCTIKNLPCKLFLCKYMADKYPELENELKKLRVIAYEQLGIYYLSFGKKIGDI